MLDNALAMQLLSVLTYNYQDILTDFELTFVYASWQEKCFLKVIKSF